MAAQWRRVRPNGTVEYDDGFSGCRVKAGHQWSLLTLVNSTPDNICYDGELQGRATAEAFPVTGSMTARGKTRNLFVVSPPGKCDEANPCPVVFYLHGHDEHVSTLVAVGGEAAQDEAWEKAKGAGFMRYAHQEDCGKTLGSVLVFPQLLEGESWVADGESIVENFLVPILDAGFKGESGRFFDPERVSIMGYSEGAEGAIHAAKLHPEIFSLAVAAAPTTPTASLSSLSLYGRSRLEPQAGHRLRLFIASFGDHDKLGSSKSGLDHLIEDLDNAAVTKYTPLHVRVYLGAGHVHWDEMFNKWPGLHQVVWEGNYDNVHKLFGTSSDE
eukprot:CAMPEP_0170612186 /NCGR_PEP_ID=MMETSP0224-20130122/23589_1 /TAXON_ID=285029 /ORGANISM="Togula jolla, Strain CCCM 725" /LENGTH=327 /DNA_ID=CAMNT_0010937673 /DNA_START=208 /DNA_END=1191 /DNA_ORIENTATION=+